jgi:hypothetical protein
VNLKAKPANRNARSTREQKMEWLRLHPEFWNMNLYRLRDLMQKEGLCSIQTTPMDMRLDEILDQLRHQQEITNVLEAERDNA